MAKESFVIEPEAVVAKIKESLNDAEVQIEDLTGTKDHYQATVVSTAFAGLSPIEQHQLVYKALAEEMKGPIHALSLKTKTP